jgi:hypothetical protein
MGGQVVGPLRGASHGHLARKGEVDPLFHELHEAIGEDDVKSA